MSKQLLSFLMLLSSATVMASAIVTVKEENGNQITVEVKGSEQECKDGKQKFILDQLDKKNKVVIKVSSCETSTFSYNHQYSSKITFIR